MLEIKDLSIVSRKTLLKDFSYRFEEGNIYGLVAINGSGKTTFFRAIMDLITNKSGKVFINDQPLYQNKEKIFYFEVSEWLDNHLCAMDYLLFIQKEWTSNKEIQPIINYWNMEDYIYLPVKKYSLGMKQRLLLAMYEVSDADILLMDESTNGLDENARAALFGVLRKLANQNKIILLSSHYKEDILRICDYLLTIEEQEMSVEKL